MTENMDINTLGYMLFWVLTDMNKKKEFTSSIELLNSIFFCIRTSNNNLVNENLSMNE